MEPIQIMLSNELDHLPLMWEPFWSPTAGVALALLVPTVFFMIFGTLDASGAGRRRICGDHSFLAELAALYFLVYDMPAVYGRISWPSGSAAVQGLRYFNQTICATRLLAGRWPARRDHARHQGAAAEQIRPDRSGNSRRS